MLDESQAACYPVCANCRVAGSCDKPALKIPKPPKPPHFRAWNEYPLVRARCGCQLLPVPIVREFGIEKVICDVHGLTTVTRETQAKARKRTAGHPGQEELPPY